MYSAVVSCNGWPLHTFDPTARSQSMQLKSSTPEDIWSMVTYREITIRSSGGPPSYCPASIGIGWRALPTTSATTRDDLRSRWP